MKSIIEQLQILAQLNDNSTKHIIAKQILMDLNNGTIENQNNLSNKIFISPSAITQFAKHLLFSGYREFIIRLRIEVEKYGYCSIMEQEKIDKNNSKAKFFMTKNIILNDIKSYDKHIEKINEIAKLLNNSRKCWFFSSYQLQEEIDFFQKMLRLKDINVTFVKFRPLDTYLANKINDNNPIFFFIAGQDNASLINVYNNIINNVITKTNNKIILLTTNSQSNKTKYYDFKIEFNNKINNDKFIYRKLYLQYLLLQIYEHC